MSPRAAAPAGSSGTTLALSLLGLFVALRLAGQISWPWVWICAPVWGPVLLYLAMRTLRAFGRGFARGLGGVARSHFRKGRRS